MVCLDCSDTAIVIDVLHAHSDLPRHMRALVTRAGTERLDG